MKHNWEYKKLGEVCTIERGGSPRPINKFITDDPTGINWIKIGDAVEGSRYISSTKERIIPEGVKKSRKVYKGDFILSNSMSFGKPYILDIDGCIHDGWLVIHDDDDAFNKDFLYYYLGSSTMYQKFKSLAVGGVVNNLNSQLVRSVSVAVPPLPVQQQIVDELDKLSEIIEKKKQQVKELDTLAQSIFYDMFGDPVENEKGWEVKKLGEVCLIKGRIGFRGYTRNDFVQSSSEGAISLSPANIIGGSMNYEKCSYISWDKYYESPEIMTYNGDILLVKTGSSFGKCAMVQNLPHKATINPQFVVIKEHKIGSRYLTAYLQSEAAKLQYEDFVLGTAIPTFSQANLGNLRTLVPPLSLQQTFAQKIEAIEKQKELINQSIKETQLLFDSRMDYYFGE